MISEVTLSGFNSHTPASDATTSLINNTRQARGQTTAARSNSFHASSGHLADAIVTAHDQDRANSNRAQGSLVARHQPSTPVNNEALADTAAPAAPKVGILRKAAKGILKAFGRHKPNANQTPAIGYSSGAHAQRIQTTSQPNANSVRFDETPTGAAGIQTLNHLMREGSEVNVYFDHFVDETIPDGLYQQAHETFNHLRNAISTLSESSNPGEWPNKLEEVENQVALLFWTLTKCAESALGTDNAVASIERIEVAERAFFSELDNLKRQF